MIKQDKAKKIVLATGIFFPDVGGPAIHVKKIAERLIEEGFNPVVICYGEGVEVGQFNFQVKNISRQYPKSTQWLFYFLTVLKESFNAKLIYAFDPTAAGLPAMIGARLFLKPFLIRVGGDPIWEREAELGHCLIPLTDYYDQGLYKRDKPRLFSLIKLVINQADFVIFYNEFWRDFYNKYFGLPLEKILVVKNPVFKRESGNPVLSDKPVIIFAGRFVAYKNLPLVMEVFDKVRQKLGKGELLLIGKGPEKDKLLSLKQRLASGEQIEFIDSLPQEQLFEKIKTSALAIGPALSEFNPNFILESLSFGKPVLLSRGHGLSVDLPDMFIFNPMDSNELEVKLTNLFDVDFYRQAVDKISQLDLNQSWDNVLDFHLDLIRKNII